MVKVSIWPQSPFSTIMFDTRFDFLNPIKYFNSFSNVSFDIRFRFLSGFKANALSETVIDEFHSTGITNKNIFNLFFFKSNFDFYDNAGKLIESCQDLVADANFTSIDPRSVFQIASILELYEIHFKACQFRTRTCPLMFRYTQLYSLVFTKMVNTYIKTNVLKFSFESQQQQLSNKTDIELNSNITQLLLNRVYNIDLDSNLLNKDVFSKVRLISIDGIVNSVQVNVFESFKELKKLEFRLNL